MLVHYTKHDVPTGKSTTKLLTNINKFMFVVSQVLLLTNKAEVPALYKALAMMNRAKLPGLMFGWVQAHKSHNKGLLDSLKVTKVRGPIM